MLPALEGFSAARLFAASAKERATISADTAAIESEVISRSDLRAVLSDTSLAAPARGLVVHDLLNGKVSDVARDLAVYAAAYAPAQEVAHAIGEVAILTREYAETGTMEFRSLGLLEARRRVAGYADGVLIGVELATYATIEEDLFRWARTVEASPELRRVLLDRDAPLESRTGLVTQLLKGRVNELSLSLANFVILGGRPRDVVGTLDFLVNYVAALRNWRVARVQTARPLDAAAQEQLIASLTTLTGHSVELQINQEADLLGGVVVEVGDLRLDASMRGRLGDLRDSVAAGHLFESQLTKND